MEDLKIKIHELDILTEELSTLRPKAAVYSKRVPSSKLFFLEDKSTLITRKKEELSETRVQMAAIPGQSPA